MSHYFPVDEIEAELRAAADEFDSSIQAIQIEEEKLEQEFLGVLEEQKIETLKKKLSI